MPRALKQIPERVALSSADGELARHGANRLIDGHAPSIDSDSGIRTSSDASLSIGGALGPCNITASALEMPAHARKHALYEGGEAACMNGHQRNGQRRSNPWSRDALCHPRRHRLGVSSLTVRAALHRASALVGNDSVCGLPRTSTEPFDLVLHGGAIQSCRSARRKVS